MRIFIATSFLFLFSVNVKGQNFQPYHAFGIQANLNQSGLYTDQEGPNVLWPGSNLHSTMVGFDMIGSYDYGMLKWLGVSSGLGFTMRGGAAESYRHQRKSTRRMFYLLVPVKLQFKPWQFFWIEPGIEAQYFLTHSDQGFQKPDRPFDPEGINPLNISGAINLRFNFYKGLSLSVGYRRGLTPVAQQASQIGAFAQTTYTDQGGHLGVRYMFNQP